VTAVAPARRFRPPAPATWAVVLGTVAALSTVAAIPLSVLAGFAARLQDATDLDSVGADLAATVQAALEPAQLSVWLPGDRR